MPRFYLICASATRKNSALILKFGNTMVLASIGELTVLRFHFTLMTPVSLTGADPGLSQGGFGELSKGMLPPGDFEN